MKLYLTVFLLLLSHFSLKAQPSETVALALRDTVLPDFFQFPMSVDFVLNSQKPLSSFKGLPSRNIPFQIKQYPMKRLFSGAHDSAYLNILVIGKPADYTVVVDLNTDRDFSNDKVFSKKMLDSGFSINFTKDHSIEERTIRIYPFDLLHKLGSADEQKWQMTITSWPAHKYAVVESGLAKKILFFASISLYTNWQKGSSIFFTEEYSYKENNQYYTAQDSIYFSKNVFIMDSITPNGSVVYFKKKERVGKCGSALGDLLCLGSLSTDHGDITIPNDNKEKVYIFHFWGSWCAPCLKEMPELEKIIRAYSQQAIFINVAYETTADLQKVKNLLTKYSTLSNNILEFPGQMPLTNRFGIAEFPSYVVVSADGYYIRRMSGDGKLSGLAQFLEEYRNRKK